MTLQKSQTWAKLTQHLRIHLTPLSYQPLCPITIRSRTDGAHPSDISRHQLDMQPIPTHPQARRMRTPFRATAVIAGILVALVACSSNPPLPPQQTTTTNSAQLPSCPKPTSTTSGDHVEFTGVHNDSPMDYGDQVTGRASIAPGHHLWIFAYGPNIERWYLMGEITHVVDGAWTSMPIYLGDGSGEDNGRYFCLGAFAVDPTVEDYLNTKVASFKGESAWITDLPTATASIIAVQLRQAKNTPAPTR
jgi:hypothetical protein